MESPGEQIMEHASTTPTGHVGSLVNADPLGASISCALASGVGSSARVV